MFCHNFFIIFEYHFFCFFLCKFDRISRFIPLLPKNEDIEEDLYIITPSDIKNEVHDSFGYTCEQCGQIFNVRVTYDIHMKTRHGKKPGHQCEFCGQYFASMRFLDDHRSRTHTKKFRYRCDKCDRGYVNLWNLKLHQDARHGTPPNFFCDKCGKGFNTKLDLKQHTTTHNNKKYVRVRGMFDPILAQDQLSQSHGPKNDQITKE